MFLTEKTIDHFSTSCREHGLRKKRSFIIPLKRELGPDNKSSLSLCSLGSKGEEHVICLESR